MATGGLALLLSPKNQPHTFPGLGAIGKVVYIFDLVIFTLTCSAILYRFLHWPSTLKASLTHPTESLFFACFFLSLASIIAGMALYGIDSSGYWLVVIYRILFWTYFAATFIAAVGLYCMLFTNPLLKIQDMTPAWDLPIFPFMLTGTVAASGIAYQPREYATPMLFAGLTAQGLGMLVSMCMYANYIRRMISFGFPSPASRPGMFIAVGPPSFTALAIIGLATHYPTGNNYFGPDDVTSQVVKILALMTAVFIWSLSFWFWAISVVSCLAVYRSLKFRLNWWAFVFPNVGFTLAIINIGKSLRSEGVLWVGSIMTVLMVLLYLFILANHVRAVLRKEVLYTGKDEDHYTEEKKGKADRRRGSEAVGISRSISSGNDD